MKNNVPNDKGFPLATANGTYYICPDEVVRLKASSNYTTIYFRDKRKLVSARVLKAFEPLLSPFGFIRTHRTHLVNRRYICCITTSGRILMSDDSVAEISRRMKTRVLKTLHTAA